MEIMQMNYFIITIIIILLSNTNFLLANSVIQVKDDLSKKHLPRVTAQFKSLDGKTKDSVIVKMSDKKGNISNPFTGKCFIRLSYIGYKVYTDTIDSKTSVLYMSPSNITTNEVVVTGHFKSTSVQESVYDVKVINETRIKSQGANNLRELLITEANMRLSQDNILGSSININGLSGENVKVMIDGVPMIGRLNGNIDISQINLSNIERVEIIEGPMSSIYGSDALGGVINLISKEPTVDLVEYDFRSYYEQVGTYNFDGTISTSLFGLNFLANAGRNLFQGYDPANTTRNLRWDPKEQYFLDFQVGYTVDEHKIRFQTRYFNEFILNRGALRPPYFESAFDDKYRTNRLSNTLFYDGKLGDDQFLNITAGHSYFNRKKNTFFKDMLTLDEKLTEIPSDQDTSVFTTYMLRAVFGDSKFLNSLQYQFGVDISIDNAEGVKIVDYSKTLSDYAGFLSVQYNPIKEITIQPSVRYIKNSVYDAPLVPALNLKFDISNNIYFRASYAKGFRAPSIKELFFQFVDINHNIFGNDKLKAETSDSYNASLFYSTNTENAFISFEPKFFYNVILNLITLANLEGTDYINVNIGKYETIGSSFTMKYIRDIVSLTAVASYIGRLNFYHDVTNTRRYNFTPEMSVSMDYLIKPIDTKFNLAYKYTGRMPAFTVINDKPTEYFVDDFHMMDLSISRKFIDIFEVYVGIKNVLNVIDINSSRGLSAGGAMIPVAWGRTFFVNFNIGLN